MLVKLYFNICNEPDPVCSDLEKSETEDIYAYDTQ